MNTNEIDALAKLSELHKSGEITDDEFAREKAKIIGAPERTITESPEAHRQRLQKQASRSRKQAFIAMGIVGGFIALFAWVFNTGPTQYVPTEEDYRIDAYSAAQTIVRNNLKSPTSADFPSIDEATIVRNGHGSYTIRSYVDASNSFGAKIRSHYTLSIHEQGDKWIANSPPVFSE